MNVMHCSFAYLLHSFICAHQARTVIMYAGKQVVLETRQALLGKRHGSGPSL
jgi:hypothetical protein